jgi:hypothetical protein
MIRRLVVILMSLVLLGTAACKKKFLVTPTSPRHPVATATPTGLVFFDDFSMDKGWTYGIEWQRGPATASIGHTYGSGDPGGDHTATGDNMLAGAVIGGNTTTDIHGFYYLTSPAFDVTGRTSLYLSFWRWYNSDYLPYAGCAVEVWDGAAWVTLFSSGSAPGVTDSSWAFLLFDLTPYLNSGLRIRFGHQVGAGGAYETSGWNLDDVMLGVNPPPTPVPTDTPTVTWTPTETWSPTPTYTGYCGINPETCTFTDTPTDTPTSTDTPTPTMTPTCIHPMGILGDDLIPSHTPDVGTPVVFGTPVLAKSLTECGAYLPGNPFCSSVDFGANSLILTRSVELCYSTWLITGVLENCIGGLTVNATCNTGCYCCDPPDEYRYTLIPATSLPINEVQCLPP